MHNNHMDEIFKREYERNKEWLKKNEIYIPELIIKDFLPHNENYIENGYPYVEQALKVNIKAPILINYETWDDIKNYLLIEKYTGKIAPVYKIILVCYDGANVEKRCVSIFSKKKDILIAFPSGKIKEQDYKIPITVNSIWFEK